MNKNVVVAMAMTALMGGGGRAWACAEEAPDDSRGRLVQKVTDATSGAEVRIYRKGPTDVTLTITRKDGSKQTVTLLLRIDTPIEVDYYRHGGILPYVLRELVGKM